MKHQFALPRSLELFLLLRLSRLRGGPGKALEEGLERAAHTYENIYFIPFFTLFFLPFPCGEIEIES